MAQGLQTTSGLLRRPGSYGTLKVVKDNRNLGVTGYVVLVGEADGGPDYTLEDRLRDNWFLPNQEGAVAAKYLGGPIVDAFSALANPSGDERVSGAPTRVYVVKTNPSTKASAALDKIGGGTYHTLADQSYGILGNLIRFTVTSKTAEVKPTTGSFTLLLPNATTALNLRVNGAAVVAPSNFAAATTPASMVSALDALTGIGCSGGADRTTVSAVSGTLAVDATANVVVITRSIAWDVTPTVGDTLYIPSGSVIQGASNENRGSYVITAADSTTITATKLLDASGAAGALTAPADVSAQAIAAVTDIKCYAPVTITIDDGATNDPIDGVGKSLEINELTSQTGRLSDLCYQLNTTKVTWVSKTSTPTQLTSSAEYAVYLNVYREMDQIQEVLGAGGDIALLIGYTGTTATLTITATALSTTVTGGSGANLSLSLGSTEQPAYPTLADLANYINSQTGYSCSVATAAMGQKSVFDLDRVSATGICSTFGNKTGRIKMDAAKFFAAIDEGSSTVQLGTTDTLNVRADAGLPDLMTSSTYLAGGTRGATTDAVVTAALAALEKIKCNFVCLLFSRNAASLDVTDGLTDSSSTYTIAGIAAAAKDHVVRLDTLQNKKQRQIVVGYRGTFSAAKEFAANLAQHRVSVAGQDVLRPTRTGGIKQFQPWMAGVLAFGMQAAAFTRGIVKRKPNISGAIWADKTFDYTSDSDVTAALEAGLLVITPDDDEQLSWESDQTTYSRDDSFYHNSIQAIYVGDIVLQGVIKRMGQATVGEALADLDPEIVKQALTQTLDQLRDLGALARSDDAPDGYTNVDVQMVSGATRIAVDIRLSTLNYFTYSELTASKIVRNG